jgi:putative hydrolase of the HAD superfamily
VTESSKQVLVFDLDDTLVDTSDVYWTARSSFVSLLAEVGLDGAEALEAFELNDEANMHAHGFAPERYLFTMRQTYLQFAQRGLFTREASVEEKIEEIGKLIWSRMPALIPGAHDVLNWATDRFRLCLLSRGVAPLQQQKLEHHRLTRYFEVVRIVKRKTANEFREILQTMQVAARDAWAIGDSVKSDINPGLKAGLRCILYVYSHHSYHWRQEYGDVAQGAFYRITRLTDIIQILQNPQAFQTVRTV